VVHVVGIEAGEVVEDLHTGVHGLLRPLTGAVSLLVAAADQHAYRGVGEKKGCRLGGLNVSKLMGNHIRVVQYCTKSVDLLV
jgi:hypothetical protein